ncbi:6314_t:CDS:2 [Dentiscutata erythropus]|uniref:6314_t:CDS:1 n=1 Tax=Dentiscutata erythropus TaxID=1348616 RepID=A0A9N9BYV9_9GLOM|nr:6314_t:CDS:2 [Dentiscutata erythropus]
MDMHNVPIFIPTQNSTQFSDCSTDYLSVETRVYPDGFFL